MTLRLTSCLSCVLVLAASVSSAQSADWALPDHHNRIAVTIDPGGKKRAQCPVGVEIDFERLFKDAGIAGRFDRNSIRVMEGNAEMPHQFSGDFANDSAGRIWWRVRDEKATRFHLYFDSLAHGQKEPPSRVGLIGIGDAFHYNNGLPGPAPVHPLHSQFWHLESI